MSKLTDTLIQRVGLDYSCMKVLNLVSKILRPIEQDKIKKFTWKRLTRGYSIPRERSSLYFFGDNIFVRYWHDGTERMGGAIEWLVGNLTFLKQSAITKVCLLPTSLAIW